MTPIPFSIELWQQGYRPVTRDGREVRGLFMDSFGNYLCGSVSNQSKVWGKDGMFNSRVEHILDLLLLPPEDEMIVTIEVMRMNESGMKYIHISDVGKIKPGKYKLTKIG